MAFKKIDPKTTFPQMEKEILQFWNENKVFEKSLAKREGAKRYSFFDGPPFATGMPHYGHIVASTMKDVVPRYWTMRGFYVERKWGWDCHGLPIENIVEKELGSKSKKDIEALGVARFNELCRSKVSGYVEDWKKVINRLGRWADMDNAYKTMDLTYMESVWWVFKELYDKGLVYEGYRAMHICPRCETTLSQSEVSEGYKDIKDLSAIAKFELVDEPGTFVLAWTTTPWTLIGNVALAAGRDIDYVKVKYDNKQGETEFFWLAKEIFKARQDDFFPSAKALAPNEVPPIPPVVVAEIKGNDLVGKKYKPLFDYYAQQENLAKRENGWQIYAGDFVTTEDGTGVVHIAPAFGEDDMRLGKEYDLPFVQHVGMDGVIKKEAGEFAGMHVKQADNHQAADIEIIKYLAYRNLLFSKEKYEHSYPHCWRCDTPLLNYATSSWFVSVEKIKERSLALAEEINWTPTHMKEGRFGKWLEGARDWSISRQRFWASVMPIWRCECGEIKVLGSVKELEELSGQKITDLHKHVVDEIKFPCAKCGQQMKRVPDVLDTWFDSGSMPYAQLHFPFENQEKFAAGFPAEFIAEGVDQTRAWFYYLHVLGTALFDQRAFSNVIVNGIVLAEDGKKMSKRLQNYPDPMDVVEKYGADALRYYLMASPVVSAQNLNFAEKEVAENVRGMLRMLWNTYSFFTLYANIDGWQAQKFEASKLENLLDKWLISELNILVRDFNSAMENYELNRAARLLPRFVDNLSNWYVRRSRKRFWKSESDSDKNQAYGTLHFVLVELSKVMAPFMPFMAEEIYKNLTGEESVHLTDFPVAEESLIDEKLNADMRDLREIISLGLQERAKQGIKVRQPLAKVFVGQKYASVFKEMLEGDLQWNQILIEELNVHGAELKGELETVGLDTVITEELRQEGVARELIRTIQEMRKAAGYEVDNRIQIWYNGQLAVFNSCGELIAKETLARDLNEGIIETELVDLTKEIQIEGETFTLQIKKS